VEIGRKVLIWLDFTSGIWGLTNMKKLAFVIGGAAALALGGCSGNNQDAVNNAELNQPAAEDLNGLANDAASNAEDQALGNQQQQLNDENAAAQDNGPNPSEAQEKNVDAM
jgi:hypothetical protein